MKALATLIDASGNKEPSSNNAILKVEEITDWGIEVEC